MSEIFDAAIVGGGPAGCSAAITLAERGAHVVLFEAKAYPHDKVCGEFLSPECAHLLDQLGLTSAVSALNPVQIETVHITAPDSTIWKARLPGEAWGLSRSALDAVLAARARERGVDVRENTTVTGIDGDFQAGFRIQMRTASEPICARTVIAAHGKRGALDRALSRRFLERPQPFVALKAHFHGPPLPRRIELHTFPGGYCGMSEIENGASNVCFMAHESVFQSVRQNSPVNVDDFLQWMQSQNPYLRNWLTQAQPITEPWLSIAQIPFVQKEVVTGDILMAGDAAGLIVPLVGDGIAMALHSGRLAGAHVSRFLAKEWTAETLRQQYASTWRREFTARLRLGRALQVIMLRPHLLALGLRLMSSFPPLGDYLVKHTRDSSIRRYV
jgi:menaquinone-9 beta-reductase